MDQRITDLVVILERAFRAKSWHGTNLYGAIRSLSAEEAAWRVAADRHNIWELTLHAAFWKYRVFRLITDAPPRSFELTGTNFFTRPIEISDEAWSEDRRLLVRWHERLVEAVRSLDARSLDARAGRSRHSVFDLVTGATAHDLYHAGQIQLLKRLM